GDWGYMPTDPDLLRAELDKREIVLLGAFVPVGLADRTKHEGGIDSALRVAKLMYNAGYINAFIVLADDNGSITERTKNAGRITPDMSLSEEQWKVYALCAERIAKAVKDNYGLKTVFHHHCAGYVETPTEIDKLLNMTNPVLLG